MMKAVFEEDNPGSCVQDRMTGSEAGDLAGNWGLRSNPSKKIRKIRSAPGRFLEKGGG